MNRQKLRAIGAAILYFLISPTIWLLAMLFMGWVCVIVGVKIVFGEGVSLIVSGVLLFAGAYLIGRGMQRGE